MEQQRTSVSPMNKVAVDGGVGSLDPWKHRASMMRCLTCMWWVAKEPEKDRPGSMVGSLGRCRRHAPTLNGYPAVFESDWCGDHKLDENRL